MWLIKSHEVEYWEISCNTGGLAQVIPVVSYKGKVFIRGRSFPKDQQHNALKEMREKFLDGLQHIPCILIESEQSFTIWYEENNLNNIQNHLNQTKLEPLDISTVNLQDIVTKIRDIGGISIQNRWYKLKLYPKCFIGSEAVNWFVNQYKISRSDAVQLGQRLLQDKYIHHVLNQHQFEDGYFFYRFYWDEQ